MAPHDRNRGHTGIPLLPEPTKIREAVEGCVLLAGVRRGTGSSSQTIMVDAATNTEKKTYAQAAAQTQGEVKEEKEKEVRGKGKGPSQRPPGSEQGASLPQRFPFVEDMSEYEEEEKKGAMTKAVVVHGV